MADPDPIDRQVGQRLREMRKARQLSLDELGRQVGVTYQQVAKYETGDNRIAASTLWRIRGALEVDIGYFFEGLDDAPAPDTKAKWTAPIDRIEPRVKNRLCDLIEAIAASYNGRAFGR